MDRKKFDLSLRSIQRRHEILVKDAKEIVTPALEIFLEHNDSVPLNYASFYIKPVLGRDWIVAWAKEKVALHPKLGFDQRSLRFFYQRNGHG